MLIGIDKSWPLMTPSNIKDWGIIRPFGFNIRILGKCYYVEIGKYYIRIR
jgi:hypothetical protein